MSEVIRHNSSYISETDYDPQTQTLDVTFTDGSQFRYTDVPRGIYTQMITSASVGREFRALIRDRYDFEEI